MTNPEDEAIHAAQEILQEDRALDVPITFHTRFVDLAPLICSFEIGDTVDGIFRRLVFDPAFAQSLAVVAENDPAFLDRTTADLTDYVESLSLQISQEMRRAQSAAEAEAAQTSDNPKMIRFLRIQTTPSVTFSYRQVEYIGQRVYEKVQEGLEHPLDPEEVKKFIPEIKEDEAKTVMLSGAIEEAKAFLYLNKAFVQAGGRDNPELRARIEEVVNQWWMTDTDIISGQPKPWDPDYFLKP